jgi:hypothetical protein
MKSAVHLKTLASAKKPVLLIEYPKTPERQALSKKLAEENGFVWLVTDRQLKTLGESGKLVFGLKTPARRSLLREARDDFDNTAKRTEDLFSESKM